MLVGVAGQFRTGKDSLSDYLGQRLNQSRVNGQVWRRAAFADEVKRIFCESFGVDRAFVERWKTVDEPPPGFHRPVREMLIHIGDGFRQFDPDVWVNKLLVGNTDNLIISDCRYPSELVAIRKKGGLVILMWRPGHENDLPSPSEQALRQHIEHAKAGRGMEGYPVDLVVCNDGTVQDLCRKVDRDVIPVIERKLLGVTTPVKPKLKQMLANWAARTQAYFPWNPCV